MRQVEDYVKSSRKQTLRLLSEVLAEPGRGPLRAERLARALRELGFRIAESVGAGGTAFRADLPGGTGRVVLFRADLGPGGAGARISSAGGEDSPAFAARTDDEAALGALVVGAAAYVGSRSAPRVGLSVLAGPSDDPAALRIAAREAATSVRPAIVVVLACGTSGSRPAVVDGLRGLCDLDLVVTSRRARPDAADRRGRAPNPANVLARILASFHAPFGRVAIPGFHDLARETDSSGEPVPEAMAALDVTELAAEPAPAGDGAEGIPKSARARILIRLVPDQEPRSVAAEAEDLLREVCPPGAGAELRVRSLAEPLLLPTGGPAFLAALRACGGLAGVESRPVRHGGVVPEIRALLEELEAEPIVLSTGIRAPDSPAGATLEEIERAAALVGSFLEELEA